MTSLELQRGEIISHVLTQGCLPKLPVSLTIMLQAFISSVDVTSDAVGNLYLIFHYVGAAGLRQTESNIKINFLPTPGS